MNRPLFISLAALALGIAPFGLQPLANDAHHPDKVTNAKKSTGVKAKQTKTPPAKPKKTSAQDSWLGGRSVSV